MVFIDADKNNYINYYNFILDNNLLRMQGVICVDNSLFKAKVYLKDTTDSNGLALREFNQFVSDDPRVEQVSFRPSLNLTYCMDLTPYFYCNNVLIFVKVIIPLRDGISVIRRVSVAYEGSMMQVPFR